MNLQYRAAAFGGVATQFAWGFMEIMIFAAFYRADENAFPMSLASTASYLWLQQAFLALFATWMTEQEIFDAIVNGMTDMDDFYLTEGGIITVNTETAEVLNIDYSVFSEMGEIVEVITTED